MKKIHSKLYEVKGKIKSIEKKMDNPFFRSKYFDINILLENLDPLLQEHGLLLLQPIIGDKLYTRLIDVETGEEEASYMEIPHLEDPQKLGSLVTYYRRYSLQSLLCLKAEDDDGNQAAGKVQDTPKETSKWLTKQQFDKACLGTQDQINNLLKSKKFKMKKEYREHLEGLLHLTESE